MTKDKIVYIGNFLTQHGYTPNFNVYLVPELEKLGYQIKKISTRLNKISRLLEMIFCPFWHKDAKFVIIDVFSSNAFWFAYLSAMSCRIVGLRYINILHGGNLPFRLKSSPKFCKILFGKAYINIAPSNYLYIVFKSEGYNLELIPNFIDPTNYSFKERTIFENKILWVRAFDKIYNPFLIIKAVQRLIVKYPDIRLTMVGPDKDGTQIEVINYIKSNNLDEHIQLTGRLSLKEWTQLSESHSIFINSTNFDNLPVSIIEAMALGFPIVSTNVGGIPYVLENNITALLINPNNVEEMIVAIEKLITSPNLVHKLSTNAHSESKKYHKDAVILQWQKILSNKSKNEKE